LTVLPPNVSPNEPVGEGIKHDLIEVNLAMMDISLVGTTVQCEEPTCTTLLKLYDFGPYLDDRHSADFKYVIDVSSGFVML
jgi:hypothetical protein